jgi:acyl dehydratase
MTVDSALPTLDKHITQEGIRRYAEASLDFNPLHLDQAFAEKSQFGGVVAHGMLLLGFLSELMTRAYGGAWAANGRLKVQFRSPARPGDRVTVTGRVTGAADTPEGRRFTCALEGRNQRGEVLLTGEAQVTPGPADREANGTEKRAR